MLFSAVWAISLATQRALDDFVFYFRTFAPDHELTGAIPVTGGGAWFWVAVVAPMALYVLTVWFVAASLWLRRPISIDEWVMVAAAVGVALYYPKFLSRAMSTVSVYAISIPLLLYWAFKAFVLFEMLLARIRQPMSGRWRAPRL